MRENAMSEVPSKREALGLSLLIFKENKTNETKSLYKKSNNKILNIFRTYIKAT